MSLSRFERRSVAKNLFEILEKYKDKSDFFVRRYSEYNGVGFLFVYYPIEKPEEQIDFVLKKAQEVYAFRHKSKKVVLLAAAQNLVQWKFSLFLANDFNDEYKDYVQKWSKEFGWFVNEKVIKSIEKEYPDE